MKPPGDSLAAVARVGEGNHAVRRTKPQDSQLVGSTLRVSLGGVDGSGAAPMDGGHVNRRHWTGHGKRTKGTQRLMMTCLFWQRMSQNNAS